MLETERVESELSYVRDLVSKSDRGRAPVTIYMLWAIICLVGFPLADFAPQYVGFYWMFAGPLGGLASGFLGWRHSRRMGQVRRDLGVRHGLHWMGTIAAIFLVVPLGVVGAVSWNVVHHVMLLVIGLSYYLAGVHLERPILWVGLLVIAAYVALFFIKVYQWTIVGVVVAIALAAAGLIGGRKRAKETD